MRTGVVGELASTAVRMAVVVALATVVVPGPHTARPPALPLSTAERAELAFARHTISADPMVLGQPLAYWQVAARTGGIDFRGWTNSAKLWVDGKHVLVMVWDPGAGRLVPLFLALAADPDPVARLVVARGLGAYADVRDPVQLGALVTLARDPDAGVRYEAGRALMGGGLRVLGQADFDRLVGPLPEEPPEPEYHFGVGPVRTAELAGHRPEDIPSAWALALAPDADDGDLQDAGRYRGLYVLYARGTRVTDAGLGHLAGLPWFTILDLRGTGVTDAGLASVRSLPMLRRVYLAGTKVTDEGVRRLRADRPGLDVRMDSD